MSEKILVILRDKLFSKNYFQGFISADKADFTKEITNNHNFLLRFSTSETQKLPAENNSKQKQIIPYIILKHKKKLFVYMRSNKSDEKRLHSKYSLGIGGHINEIDINSSDIILEALKRELNEELIIDFDYFPKIVGYINDDSDDVGKVHFGVVFVINCPTGNVQVRERDKISGSFMNLRQINGIKDGFENWSKIVYDAVGRDLVM